MDYKDFVKAKIGYYFCEKDYNCAITTLRILSEYFNLPVSSQVIESAIGLGSLGNYGAQCGLIDGAVMFMGILGKEHGFDDETIAGLANEYAGEFEKKFESLSCRVLRPEGFKPENPPHLCENLAVRVICFDIEFINDLL
jgi:hypothetical protein